MCFLRGSSSVLNTIQVSLDGAGGVSDTWAAATFVNYLYIYISSVNYAIVRLLGKPHFVIVTPATREPDYNNDSC